MVHTNDGFEIAEMDMRLRAGDLEGTPAKRDRLDLRIANLAKDADLLENGPSRSPRYP